MFTRTINIRIKEFIRKTIDCNIFYNVSQYLEKIISNEI